MTTMIKYTRFMRYRADLDRTEAERRWREELAPIQLRLQGIERCVLNVVESAATNEGANDGPPGFDGMTSLWFTDMGVFDAALASQAWSAAEACGHDIFDTTWRGGDVSAEIEERVRRVGMGAVADGVSTPPADSVKLVGFLTYRSDLARADANDYWRTTHGRIALGVTEMGHYVQSHAIRGPGGARAPGFDGYSEAWFASLDAYEHAMASDAWKALVADGPELFDMSVFLSAIVREHVIRESRR